MKSELEKISTKIDKLQAKINEMQHACEHKNIEKSYSANTGNYDQIDIYYTHFRCIDCGKKWTEKESKWTGRRY